MKKQRNFWALVLLPIFIAGGALLAGYWGTVTAAPQATLMVTTLDDVADSCAIGGCSLRDAIAEASAGDTISFTVSGTIALSPTLGHLQIDKDLTIDGGEMIEINGQEETRVFNLTTTVGAIDVTIANLTIADGVVTETQSYCGGYIGDLCGGGIIMQNSDVALTVNNVLFIRNEAEYGGAIENSGGDLTVIDSRFQANTADFSGGAIEHYGGGELTVMGSSFFLNFSAGDGGAVFLYDLEAAQFTDNSFIVNRATDYGGGIYADIVPDLLIEETSIRASRAWDGGGIYLYESTAVISDTTLTYNTADSFGGGLFIDAMSTIEVINSDVLTNTAMFGGGAFVYSSTLSLDGSVVEGNYADYSGGGIYHTSEDWIFGELGGPPGRTGDSEGLHEGRQLFASSRQVTAAHPELAIHDSLVFNNEAYDYGGGVYVESIDLTIHGETLFDYNYSMVGGGLFVVSGTADIVDSMFTQNHAAYEGGAILSVGGVALARQVERGTAGEEDARSYFDALTADMRSIAAERPLLTISNTSFISNSSYYYGGALASYGYDLFITDNSSFIGNEAMDGGAIFTVINETIIESSEFEFNSIYDPYEGGGAIFADALLYISETTFTDNFIEIIGECEIMCIEDVGQGGGAIHTFYDTFIEDSVFTGNSADDSFGGGGAIYADGLLSVIGSEFSGNTAYDAGSALIFLPREADDRDLAEGSGFGGGAIYASDELYVTDTIFEANSADGSGGEIIFGAGGGAIYSSGWAELDNNLYVDNTADDSSSGGGAIYARGIADIYDSTFIGNSAVGDALGGGAIYANETGVVDMTMLVSGSLFEDNYGTNGGAIYNYNSEVSVIDSDVTANAATDSGGGLYARTGIVLSEGTAVYTITGTTIAGNIAETVRGGGLYIREGSTAYVANSTISGNWAAGLDGIAEDAGNGGGIYVGALLPNVLTLNNVTVTDNEAAGSGGGIDFNRLDTGDMITITNSIVAGNRDTGGYPDCYDNETASYTLTLDGNNLFGGADGDICADAAGVSDLSLEALALTIDDVLEELTNNNGLEAGSDLADTVIIQTHRLAEGSVAIDAADNASCEATDQRGIERPTDGDDDEIAICDIGAVEDVTYILYLPIIMKPGAPDLVIDQITLMADDVEVVILNQGEGSANTDFWVDLYINPDTPPLGVNDTWEAIGGEAIVWGITGLVLAPGETYTLTLDSVYISDDRTNFSGLIVIGDTIYGQVDSANLNSDNGGVLENHEILGGTYNNIEMMTATTAVSTLD